MSEQDPTRRDFIRQSGAGLLAAAVVAPTTQLAPPDKQPPDLKLPPGKTKKAGYAIVGLGELALEEILPAFGKCKLSQLVALVSGHRAKAEKVAESYGVDSKAIYDYKNFEALEDNPAVDVVYIVLPNSLHKEYALRSFKIGKHVLCEKPLAVNADQAREMCVAARASGKKFMCAYRLHYEPFNQEAIRLSRSGEFGKLKVFEAVNVQNTKAPNIRLSKETAGGPLGDVGIYCLNASRYITGEEPVEVSAMLHQPQDDPRFAEVAESINWQARFPSGALAICSASFGAEESRRYRAHFADGWLELDPAFSYRGLKLRTKKGLETTEHDITPADHFQAEMDHFADCVLNDKPPATPGEEGLRDMVIVDAIKQAAWTGQTVKIPKMP